MEVAPTQEMIDESYQSLVETTGIDNDLVKVVFNKAYSVGYMRGFVEGIRHLGEEMNK